MSAVLTLAADPSTSVLLHSVTALQGPIVTGISDTANGMIANWTTVFKGAAVLAAIIIVLFTAIKTKLAVASMIISVIVAAFLLWAVTGNGLGWFSNSIDQEVSGSPAVIQILDGESL